MATIAAFRTCLTRRSSFAWCGLLAAVALSPSATVLFADANFIGELRSEKTFSISGSVMAFGYDQLWIVSNGKLLSINITDYNITETSIPGSDSAMILMEFDRYRGIAIGEDAVWIPDLASSTIIKIHPQEHSVMSSIPTDIFGSQGSIGVGEGSVWVITFDNHDKTLTRYNAVSGTIEAQIALPQPCKGVLSAFGSIWVTAAREGVVYRIDPKSNEIVNTITTHGPMHLITADDDGSVWLGHDNDGVVERIDSSSNQVVSTIDVGVTDMESDGDITVGGGYVWMINRAGIVARVDPAINAAMGAFRSPKESGSGRRLRFGGGSLWLSGSAVQRVAPPE